MTIELAVLLQAWSVCRKIEREKGVQRMMKLLVLAVVLVLVVTGGSALDCLHCVPEKAGGACEITTVTCTPDKDACAAAKFRRSPCCEMVKQNAYINIKCCQKDFCNTFD
ncbi:hypothetical protein QQF64_034830 [Cirrhinus molitorella]|uniref:CD59 glycoprotein-like n=1 Tax=Cirrhinus molitorella TaxID=172907 RepID=A0ABR3L5J3_9TELE